MASPLDQWIASPSGRHNFYCFTTICYNEAEPIFALMVQQFENSGDAKQAKLISEWFLEGNIPESLREGDYICDLNVPGDVKKTFGSVALQASNSPNKGIFDKIYAEVKKNLSSASSNRNNVHDKSVFS